MHRCAVQEAASGKFEARENSFTVVFEPVSNGPSPIRRRTASRKVHKFKAPSASGYQVTVALLPGLITYGRTLAEAREMARDAIRCHIEGLRKDGERIPDEKSARKEKMRIALTA